MNITINTVSLRGFEKLLIFGVILQILLEIAFIVVEFEHLTDVFTVLLERNVFLFLLVF